MYDGGGYAKGGGGSGGKARALYDFTGQTPTDLSFRKGDVINIVSTQSNSGPEWWYGELKGKKGDFPHNHVERMNDIAVAPSASSYAPQSYAPQPYSPQPQSYAPQSYSPQPYGGGAAAPYSPAPYGGSSGYNPDPAPTSMDTSANQKPPKSSGGGGGSSSFSGSGGEGGRFGMIFFGVHMGNLVVSSLSLILPWYCNYVAQKFGVRTWQWLGISESTLGKVNSFFPPPSLAAGYRPYPSLNYPNMGSVLIVTFVFMLIATVVAFVTTCWAHMYRTEKYPGTMRKFVIGSGINAIASIIGFCQFFRFTKAYAIDVEPGCVADICASFSGSANGNFWGPTFGWVMGLFAMLFSLGCFGLVFKKAKDADELPQIPFLNR